MKTKADGTTLPVTGPQYKVVIPRGTGQSYGIRLGSEMRVTDETKVTDGRTEGRNVYRRCERLGLSLCAVPSFNGTVVSFDLEGNRKLRKGT